MRIALLLLLVGCAVTPSPNSSAPVDPALRLHGHNDYLQPVPLTRALEYGNPKGNLEPRPFLRPALYSNRKQIVKILARGLFK